MTVKKLTIIEDGRLVPTDLSMDADLIEISKVEGNKLEAKEDGLYYSEASLKIEIVAGVPMICPLWFYFFSNSRLFFKCLVLRL